MQWDLPGDLHSEGGGDRDLDHAQVSCSAVGRASNMGLFESRAAI